MMVVQSTLPKLQENGTTSVHLGANGGICPVCDMQGSDVAI